MGLLGMVWNVWFLDFMQERFQDTSSDDFESTFIKNEDSEIKEGLRVDKARTQE